MTVYRGIQPTFSNRPTNQPTDGSTDRPTDQLTNSPTDRPIDQPPDRPINLPIDRHSVAPRHTPDGEVSQVGAKYKMNTILADLWDFYREDGVGWG